MNWMGGTQRRVRRGIQGKCAQLRDGFERIRQQRAVQASIDVETTDAIDAGARSRATAVKTDLGSVCGPSASVRPGQSPSRTRRCRSRTRRPPQSSLVHGPLAVLVAPELRTGHALQPSCSRAGPQPRRRRPHHVDVDSCDRAATCRSQVGVDRSVVRTIDDTDAKLRSKRFSEAVDADWRRATADGLGAAKESSQKMTILSSPSRPGLVYGVDAPEGCRTPSPARRAWSSINKLLALPSSPSSAVARTTSDSAALRLT
mmetsp:Transcript_43239/g.119560  ORF Transcript_43239/g.119560 Transcript_43239/m.119560 type:complete len:259 (-) Transcript_43239:208-984(-)